MEINSARVHIAGSAHAETVSLDKLRYAHSVIAGLVGRLAAAGAAFVVTPGREPRVVEGDESFPSIIFDWAVLETLGEALQEGHASPGTRLGKLVTAVVTEKTDSHIPAARRPLWEHLIDVGALRLEFTEPDWTSGAVRRQRAVREGSLFIPISGGEGVEHLAQEYLAAGKPVIPLDLELGSSTEGPQGRAVRMASRARTEPWRFVELTDRGTGAELLARIAMRDGATPADRVIQGVLDIVAAMRPPSVFYVRLLNDQLDDFPTVERYFREVVDDVVTRLGYRGLEMGRERPSTAWMDAEIFDRLHHAQIALVDLTGLRNNCFMEMGYAFGHQQPVLLLAQEGTRLPFDSSAIDCHMWSPDDPNNQRSRALEEYWHRIIERPPLVRPHGLT